MDRFFPRYCIRANDAARDFFGVLQTLAEARAASGRFLNYGKQHKKIRVRKTLGLADFGGSAGGLRPLWIRMGLLHMNSPIDTRITAN